MHCTGMKRLSPLQVAAVSLLACAVFIVSADPGTSCAASASSDSPLRDATGEGDRTTTGDAARGHAQRNVLIGLSLTLVANGLSTLGGVCCEWLLKEPTQRPLSLHWQNAQIYVWGSVINAAALLLGEACGGVRGGALLRGYSAAAWCLVANNAAVGLCTSAVLKVRDSYARGQRRTARARAPTQRPFAAPLLASTARALPAAGQRCARVRAWRRNGRHVGPVGHPFPPGALASSGRCHLGGGRVGLHLPFLVLQ
mgnify:CR=1 FL=1